MAEQLGVSGRCIGFARLMLQIRIAMGLEEQKEQVGELCHPLLVVLVHVPPDSIPAPTSEGLRWDQGIRTRSRTRGFCPPAGSSAGAGRF